VSAFIVKTGWFWVSVQNEAAADEKEYLFEHVSADDNIIIIIIIVIVITIIIFVLIILLLLFSI